MKYRADVLAAGETTWASNALTFDTEREALAYAHELANRWTSVRKARIVPDTTLRGETYRPGSEHPDWR